MSNHYSSQVNQDNNQGNQGSSYHDGSNLGSERRGPGGGRNLREDVNGQNYLQGKSSFMPPSYSVQSLTSNTDRLDLDDEGFFYDDDEIFLKPGEPYGALMKGVENPYIRANKVEEANRELFKTPLRERRTNIRVRFREERNKYYYEDYDDSPFQDYDAMNEVPADLGMQRSNRNTISPSSESDITRYQGSSR